MTINPLYFLLPQAVFLVAAVPFLSSGEETEAAVSKQLLTLQFLAVLAILCHPLGCTALSTPLTVAVVFLPAESPGCAAVPCGLSPVPTGQGGHEPLRTQ